MYILTLFAALAVSTAVLIHLARTDPKRRRVFGLPEHQGRRWTKASVAVLIAPGIALLATGDAAGFTIWLGALTVIGWGIAALNPGRSAAVGAAFRRSIGRTGTAALGVWHGVCSMRDLYVTLRAAPARIEALEARVAELEAEAEHRSEKVAIRRATG